MKMKLVRMLPFLEDEKFWPRLSFNKRYYIIHQYREGRIPFDFNTLMHLMSQNEIKKYKGE
jgi:hypothetical protein